MRADLAALADRAASTGQCPGCGASLAEAHESPTLLHYRGGDLVKDAALGERLTTTGEPAGPAMEGDERVCRFTSDDIATIVLVATGVVR